MRNSNLIKPNIFGESQTFTAGTAYTIESNGIVRFIADISANQWANVVVQVNGIEVYRIQNTVSGTGYTVTQTIYVKKGDIFKLTKDENSTLSKCNFYPQ